MSIFFTFKCKYFNEQIEWTNLEINQLTNQLIWKFLWIICVLNWIVSIFLESIHLKKGKMPERTSFQGYPSARTSHVHHNPISDKNG